MILAIGDIFDFIRNGMSVKQSSDIDGLPITRIETIWNAEIDLSRVGYASVQLANAKDYLLKDGDILFSHINSVTHIGKCALYNQSHGELVHGMNLLCFRPNQTKILPKYALYTLRSNQFKDQLARSIKKAVNQASVTIGDIKKIQIEIPPLAEQQRIAAILDKAENLKRRREYAIEKLDELGQSIFVDMFLNNAIYKPQSISDICTLVTDGTHYTPKDIEAGIPFLTVRNMSDEGLDFIGCSFISRADFDAAKSGNCAPQVNDVLFSKDGTVGKVHVVEEYNEFAVLSSIAILRPNKNKVLSQYLGYALRSSKIMDSAISKKTGVAIRRIILANLKSLQIPIPPIEKQRIFLQKISKLHQIKIKSKLNLQKLNDLFVSIQSQAFSSKLKKNE